MIDFLLLIIRLLRPICLISLVRFHEKITVNAIEINSQQQSQLNAFPVFDLLSKGIYQLFTPPNEEKPIEFIYQLPSTIPSLPSVSSDKPKKSAESTTSSSSSSSSYQGVVLLFHGCTKSSRHWWPSSPTCPKCIGVPIEMSLTYEALQRQMIPLAISSLDKSGCFHGEKDEPRIQKLLTYFYQTILKEKGLNDKGTLIPLYTLGGSFGGQFAGYLGQSLSLHPPVQAAVIQASSTPLRHSSSKLAEISSTKAAPIIMAAFLFLPMVKDPAPWKHLMSVHRKLTSSFILKVYERKLSPTFFFEHSHGFITSNESENIFQHLIQHGIIEKNGLILQNPRQSGWQKVSL